MMSRPCAIAALGTGLTLSACATQPRVYSLRELGTVAEKCGVADTEVTQMGPHKELLFLLTATPNKGQLDCATRWAKQHHLKLVYVQAVEQEAGSTEH